MLRRTVLIALATGWAGCSGHSEASRGAAAYTYCVSCHGEEGEGNVAVGAPAIAGLDHEYVATQLMNFKKAIRGAHPKDINGMKMKPMALVLENDADIPAVAAYVGRLRPLTPAPTVKGDAAKGKVLYATCAACHQADASGSKPLKAPSLRNTHDWYLLTQIRNFKAGIRGSNPADVGGQQMRPMAQTLADDQAMKDVVAYITSISRKAK